MSFRSQAYLTWTYGQVQFIVGTVYNAFCTLLLATGFSYAFFVQAFIIKAVVYAITLYLVRQFRSRDAIFFYINLGLSRRKMEVRVLATDFLALAIMLTIVLLIHG